MFEVGGAAFVSTKGDVLGRVEGYYDQRITQRLILQPRVELNLAAQDMRATGSAPGSPTPSWGFGCATRSGASSRHMSASPTRRRPGRPRAMPGRTATIRPRPVLVAGIRFWF